jgi:hypothetical protein
MGAPSAPLPHCNNGSTDLLRTSFKKILVFFKANSMEHSVAQAIRTVGAQICRRLDVLIEAAGKPPVKDFEGTPAPRKPLAPNVHMQMTKEHNTPTSARKRGRPCKIKPETPVEEPQPSASLLPPTGTSGDTCEVNAISIFLYIFLLFLPGCLL